MRRLVIAALFCCPAIVQAQDIKCPKGYQPYASRCVTQRMSDYIACVEASGGNRQEIVETINELGGQKASTNIKGSGSGVVIKGSVGLALDKASERAIARRLETRWFPKGMSECSKVLNKPTEREMKKAVKEAVQESIPQTSGVLLPGNKQRPQSLSWCIADTPLSEPILIYGDSVSNLKVSPQTIILAGNQRMLVFEKKKGGIAIAGRFFSNDSKIVAELKDNKFYINPNNYFRIERPDKHSLIVYDQEGNTTLDVDYLNPTTIKILGKFYLPNRSPITIDDNGILVDTNRISRLCFTSGGKAIVKAY